MAAERAMSRRAPILSSAHPAEGSGNRCEDWLKGSPRREGAGVFIHPFQAVAGKGASFQHVCPAPVTGPVCSWGPRSTEKRHPFRRGPLEGGRAG